MGPRERTGQGARHSRRGSGEGGGGTQEEKCQQGRDGWTDRLRLVNGRFACMMLLDGRFKSQPHGLGIELFKRIDQASFRVLVVCATIRCRVL